MSRSRKSRSSVPLRWAMAVVLGLTAAGGVARSAAADASPFTLDRQTIFLVQSTNTLPSCVGGNCQTLYTIVQQDDGTAVRGYVGGQENQTLGFGYNAIGYRVADDYIYGIETVGTAGYLVQVGSDGVATRLGQPENESGSLLLAIPGQSSASFNAGTFGSPDDGTGDLLYVRSGEGGGSGYEYELNFGRLQNSNNELCAPGSPVSATCLPTLTRRTINYNGNAVDNTPDLFYLDGYLWGVATATNASTLDCQTNSGTTGCQVFLYRFNPAGGAADRFSISGLIDVADRTDQGFGAQWIYANGLVGISNNTTGKIYQLAIENAASASPTVTVANTIDGPASNGNDGTTFPGHPINLAVAKTVAASSDPAFFADRIDFRQGDALHYRVTVTNADPLYPSTGWFLDDALPAGLDLTTWALVSDDVECGVADGVMSCTGGEIAPGESVTIEYTAQPLPGVTDPLTNTVTVWGNEGDPEPASNTASATATPAAPLPALAVDISPGVYDPVTGTMTWTVTALNSGDGAATGVEVAYQLGDFLAGAAWSASVEVAGRSAFDGVTWTILELGPGESLTATITATVDREALVAAGGSAVTTVTIASDDLPVPADAAEPNDGADADTDQWDQADTEFPLPGITVDKHSDVDVLPQPGADIPYTFTVSNTGNVTLTDIRLDDPNIPAVDCPQDTLDPGADMVCTGTWNAVSAEELADGEATNTVEASGEWQWQWPDGNGGFVLDGGVVTADDEFTIPYTATSLSVSKYSPVVGGEPLFGTPDNPLLLAEVDSRTAPLPLAFTVTNTGTEALTDLGWNDWAPTVAQVEEWQ